MNNLFPTWIQNRVKRPPNFRLEIPGDEHLKNCIQEKCQEVKR